MADANVVVVGFRCAGAPLAYALQRAGVRVIVIDQDPFFTDQPIRASRGWRGRRPTWGVTSTSPGYRDYGLGQEVLT
jgi:glycine/D-amino acid oxidase-like deaminating enzyme